MHQPFDLEPLSAIDGSAVLSLEQAKAHLAVVDADEDGLIEGLRDAAIEAIEQYCERAMVPRNYRLRLDRFPLANPTVPDRRIALPMGATAIVSVKYRDVAGDLITLDTAAYRLGRGAITPALGTSWPATAALPGAVEIDYSAGLIVPAQLVQAVKLLMGTFYRHRESVGMGTMSEMPHGVKMLCAPYRMYHV